jgi:peptide/nickel transport system substrate-binding protein
VTSTYNRRQFLGHSAAAAGGVVAAGAIADQLVGAMPAGAVTKGGTLTVGLISDPNAPFNPDYGNLDTTGFWIGRAVYDPLCVVGPNGAVYPYLCKSLTHDGTYKNWTITARPGIKFHDGTPCNGDAIYKNLVADYNSDLTGIAVRSLIKGFSHTTGSDTVVVHTLNKWVTFPYTLAEQQIAFIAQPDTLGGPTGNPKPIGTGPFIYNSWNNNPLGNFEVLANPDYWRPNMPYLDAVNFVFQPDSGTRLNELTDGTFDMIIEGDGPTIKNLKALNGHGYNVLSDYPGTPTGYSPSSNCIMLNCGAAPFNNPNLRTGCAYAIDTATYVSVVDGGESVPINGIFLPNSPYYKKPPYPKYDLKTAKSFISKVPAAQRKFTLQYVLDDPTILNAAEFVQSSLNAAGCTVTLKGVTQGQLITNAIGGNFQCMTWAQFGTTSPDLDYPWFSTKEKNFFGNLNFARNLDPKIQSLMLTGMAATTTKAREAAWGAVNNEINKLPTTASNFGIPYLWTDRTVLAVGAKSNVQNWQTFQEPAGHAVLQPNQAVLFLGTTWKS